MPESSNQPHQVQESFESTYSGASASATECMLSLVQVGLLATSRLLKFLAPYGLSGFSFNALAIIAGAEEPLSPHQVSDRMLIARNTLTGVLDSLERRQLIQRRPHPTNRKMILLEATPAGHQFIEELLKQLHRAEVEWLAWLPEDDRRTLLALLGRVRENFLPGAEVRRAMESAEAGRWNPPKS